MPPEGPELHGSQHPAPHAQPSIPVAAISTCGSHPKHGILQYERWFLERTPKGSRVLDVGSNQGRLSFFLAQQAGEVVGVEIVESFYSKAVKSNSYRNVKFFNNDICAIAASLDEFDVIVMSNVLEHIEKRVEVLKVLNSCLSRSESSAATLLLRVPQFDRDWVTPFKQSRNIEWRSDPTHYVEYTFDALAEELTAADWSIVESSFQFGEIYAVAKLKEVECSPSA